ncbi:hypothetical protein ACH5RR_023041 [Cinchona calisaya]|uniref:Uncharacterized protein n=1 Tax=Cinchona calisaya TaxID=153742 RepID=A0ABD2ZAL9_9GENT
MIPILLSVIVLNFYDIVLSLQISQLDFNKTFILPADSGGNNHQTTMFLPLSLSPPRLNHSSSAVSVQRSSHHLHCRRPNAHMPLHNDLLLNGLVVHPPHHNPLKDTSITQGGAKIEGENAAAEEQSQHCKTQHLVAPVDAIDGNIGITAAKEFAVDSNVDLRTAIDDTTTWDVSIESVTAPGSDVDAAAAAGETAILTTSKDVAIDRYAAASSKCTVDATVIGKTAIIPVAV